MKITFTRREVREIIIAAFALSIAFAVSSQEGIFGYFGGALELSRLPVFALISFIAVGIGFLAHELIGHKIIAMRLGFHGEFKMWRMGLLIALVSSVFGFVFAAPGAVYVSPRVDLWGQPENVSKKKMGIVSAAGPAINIGLAVVFFALSIVSPLTLFGESVFSIAVFVNVWLALFNMLPIPPLDGSKVLAWNRRLYVIMMAICAGLFIGIAAS
jgi:Zn-dependent protease